MAPDITVCVYCGSGTGTNPRYAEAAQALGRLFAQNNIRLVYGGAGTGVMGAMAKAVLDHGGYVTGVTTDFLNAREGRLREVQQLLMASDMQDRKRMMFELSDAFIALPGGVGTLEELFEQLTLQQLGRHRKPIILASIDDFWKPLLGLLEHLRATEFIRPSHDVDIRVVDSIGDIIPLLRSRKTSVGEP